MRAVPASPLPVPRRCPHWARKRTSRLHLSLSRALALSLASLVLIGLAALTPRASLTAQQRPIFRSGVEVVQIDVNVVDPSHMPVGDLKPADFTITVDRRPRKVVSAQFIQYNASAAVRSTPQPPGIARKAESTAGPSSPAPARNVLLVIDADSMEPGDGLVSKKAAERLLDRLSPDDRVGVATIPWLRQEIVMTKNRDETLKALADVTTGNERYRPLQYKVGLAEAFEVERGNRQPLNNIIRRECCGETAPWPCTPRDPGCPADIEMLVRQVCLQAHLRSERSLESLRALGEDLSQVMGPKTMVLITGGLPPADIKSVDYYNRVAGALAAGQVALYTIYLEQATFGQVKNSLSPTFAEDAGPEREGIENATAAAGGTFIQAIGRLEQYFDRIITELSGSYLLGIEVEARDRDGKVHDVQVKVNRRGLEVRARKQYLIRPGEPKATDATRAAPLPVAVPNPARDLELTPAELDPILNRAGAYVQGYETRFLAIGAVERSDLKLSTWSTKSGKAAWSVDAERRVAADYLLVKRPASPGWSAFRDTFEVDGKPVRNRDRRLRALLLEGQDAIFESGKRITEESARYDIGFVDRIANVPVASLLFLHPANIRRFVFARQTEQAPQTTAPWQLAYLERGSPTIMQGSRGDAPMEGVFLIEPATGTVVKSIVRWTIDGTRSEVTVTYGRSDQSADLWVPTETLEVYTTSSTKFECLTRYSNFSRFELSMTNPQSPLPHAFSPGVRTRAGTARGSAPAGRSGRP